MLDRDRLEMHTSDQTTFFIASRGSPTGHRLRSNQGTLRRRTRAQALRGRDRVQHRGAPLRRAMHDPLWDDSWRAHRPVEHLDAPDPDAVQPLEIERDPVEIDVPIHPVPPGARASRIGRAAEALPQRALIHQPCLRSDGAAQAAAPSRGAASSGRPAGDECGSHKAMRSAANSESSARWTAPAQTGGITERRRLDPQRARRQRQRSPINRFPDRGKHVVTRRGDTAAEHDEGRVVEADECGERVPTS